MSIIRGTPGDDPLTGDVNGVAEADTISGLGGNDLLTGLGGAARSSSATPTTIRLPSSRSSSTASGSG
jgi:hypothetical protein